MSRHIRFILLLSACLVPQVASAGYTKNCERAVARWSAVTATPVPAEQAVTWCAQSSKALTSAYGRSIYTSFAGLDKPAPKDLKRYFTHLNHWARRHSSKGNKSDAKAFKGHIKVLNQAVEEWLSEADQAGIASDSVYPTFIAYLVEKDKGIKECMKDRPGITDLEVPDLRSKARFATVGMDVPALVGELTSGRVKAIESAHLTCVAAGKSLYEGTGPGLALAKRQNQVAKFRFLVEDYTSRVEVLGSQAKECSGVNTGNAIYQLESRLKKCEGLLRQWPGDEVLFSKLGIPSVAELEKLKQEISGVIAAASFAKEEKRKATQAIKNKKLATWNHNAFNCVVQSAFPGESPQNSAHSFSWDGSTLTLDQQFGCYLDGNTAVCEGWYGASTDGVFRFTRTSGSAGRMAWHILSSPDYPTYQGNCTVRGR